MLATPRAPPLNEWRRRLGGRRRFHRRPRPWAAIGYLANGPVVADLIEIQRLVMVALYDESLGHGRHAVRLVGFSGTRDPWGARFGGSDQCRFFKDLLLQPMPGARGLRLDASSRGLLSLGLALDRMVECHARRRTSMKRQLYLPRLWAGFRPSDTAAIAAEGPELTRACELHGETPERLLAQVRRQHFGLALYPLPWVSRHVNRAVAVFADLAKFPLRHAFPVSRPVDDLAGFQTAIQFDFFKSRFRTSPRSHRGRQAPALAAA